MTETYALPLDRIVDGALDTLLWLALDPVTGETVDARGEDVPEDMREAVTSTLEDFCTLAGEDVMTYLQTMTPEQLGHDFILTSNRHGAGFWDRGMGELGNRLTSYAHPYGELVAACDDEGNVSIY